MKHLKLLLFFILASAFAYGQTSDNLPGSPITSKAIQIYKSTDGKTRAGSIDRKFEVMAYQRSLDSTANLKQNILFYNIKDYGGSSNGISANDAALNATKVASGKYRTVYFPNNSVGNAVYFFSSVPDLNNYVVQSDDSVSLSFPTTNSIDFTKVRFSNKIHIISRDRDNTGEIISNYNSPDFLVPISGIDRNEQVTSLSSLTGGSFSKRLYNVASDSYVTGSSSPTTLYQVEWPVNTVASSASPDSLTYDVAMRSATIENEYSCSFSTTANQIAGRSGVMLISDGEWCFFGMGASGYKFTSKKSGLSATSIYIGNIVSGAYRFNSTSIPEVSVRIVDINTAEFYVNGLKVFSYDISGTINSVGFGVNRSINTSGAQYANNFTMGRTITRVSGGVIRLGIFGDSISYGEGSSFSYPELIKKALTGRAGISNVLIDNYSVSGHTAAAQLAKMIDTDLSVYDYTLVMVGTNDIFAQTNISDFRSTIQGIINKVGSDGSKLIIGVPPMYIDSLSTGGGYATVNYSKGGDYRTLIKERAGANNILLADVNSFFGEVGTNNTQLRDNIHPQSFFETAIARSFATSILYDKQRSLEFLTPIAISSGNTIAANTTGNAATASSLVVPDDLQSITDRDSVTNNNMTVKNSSIGQWSASSSWARFGHKDFNTTSNYGYLQSDGGGIVIEGPTVNVSGVAVFADNVTAPTFIGNLTGNATTATTAGTANALGVYAWNPSPISTFDYLFGRNAANEIRPISVANIKSSLGLGSAAYETPSQSPTPSTIPIRTSDGYLAAETAPPGTANTIVANTAFVSAAIAATGASSGTYTPTVTLGANVSAVTLEKAHYMRVGNEVTVTVGYLMATSTSGSNIFYLSLPIPSNLTADDDLIGSWNTNNLKFVNKIVADKTNDRALCAGATTGMSSETGTITFTYTVK